jgi:murein DD-endopeptidase MepM/ murein hydrolase activator NlpD
MSVRPGDTISRGGLLGQVGSTGNSTGNHLHYEIRDRAGNLLRGAMQAVMGGANVGGGFDLGATVSGGVTAAKDAALTALDKALESVPVVGNIWTASKASGIPNIFDAAKGECGLNPICHLKTWLEETGFIQRFALFIVAIVLIIGGIAFLSKGYSPLETARKAIA